MNPKVRPKTNDKLEIDAAHSQYAARRKLVYYIIQTL